jgi:hypothetical protein
MLSASGCRKDSMAEQERWYCTHHPDTFVTPFKQKNKRHSGCWKCFREHNSKPETRCRREKRWNTEIIACIAHPERRCNKSHYVSNSHRYCCWCIKHRPDGTVKAWRKRASVVSARKHYDRKRMARYAKNPARRKSISEILRMRLGIR